MGSAENSDNDVARIAGKQRGRAYLGRADDADELWDDDFRDSDYGADFCVAGVLFYTVRATGGLAAGECGSGDQGVQLERDCGVGGDRAVYWIEFCGDAADGVDAGVCRIDGSGPVEDSAAALDDAGAVGSLRGVDGDSGEGSRDDLLVAISKAFGAADC